MEKEKTEAEKDQEVIDEARKVMQAGTIDKLVTLANTFDTKGMTREATIIDDFLTEYYGPCKDCE